MAVIWKSGMFHFQLYTLQNDLPVFQGSSLKSVKYFEMQMKDAGNPCSYRFPEFHILLWAASANHHDLPWQLFGNCAKSNSSIHTLKYVRLSND